MAMALLNMIRDTRLFAVTIHVYIYPVRCIDMVYGLQLAYHGIAEIGSSPLTPSS